MDQAGAIKSPRFTFFNAFGSPDAVVILLNFLDSIAIKREPNLIKSPFMAGVKSAIGAFSMVTAMSILSSDAVKTIIA